ncbi:MAG: aldehyde dehydrogenase family protein [Rubripirellula sp.]
MQSTSPIDGATVWEGQSALPDQVRAAVKRSSEAGLHWRTTSVESRVEIVRSYAKYLEDHRDEIATLISREVGKLAWDAAGEVRASIAKVELSIQAFQQRRSEQTIDPAAGAVRRIRYQPLGVALVLGPFNFPLHLPGGQIIPALLAGNTVIFKPSDQATAVGMWIAEAWRAAGLPEGVMEAIVGGVPTAVAAIDCPEVAGVFLTGSRAAGRAIHRQLAGRPNVLLALELGGNNPIVIEESVRPDDAAATVSFSAFISAGQRCTCSRRAIFIGKRADEKVEALVKMTRELHVGLPSDDPSPQVGPVISDHAAAGLRATYDSLLELGCRPLVPWKVGEQPNLVHPAIVDGSSLDQAGLEALADMEWFGPLLVVHRVDGTGAAIRLASETNYGLAASLLGGDEELFLKFVDQVGAGVVNWNGPTTGAAGALPFGGLGDSGNHRPAGFFAVDFCSDPIASLERTELNTTDPWDITK